MPPIVVVQSRLHPLDLCFQPGNEACLGSLVKLHLDLLDQPLCCHKELLIVFFLVIHGGRHAGGNLGNMYPDQVCSKFIVFTHALTDGEERGLDMIIMICTVVVDVNSEQVVVLLFMIIRVNVQAKDEVGRHAIAADIGPYGAFLLVAGDEVADTRCENGGDVHLVAAAALEADLHWHGGRGNLVDTCSECRSDVATVVQDTAGAPSVPGTAVHCPGVVCVPETESVNRGKSPDKQAAQVIPAVGYHDDVPGAVLLFLGCPTI
jgi:hypothetical protein